jgi:hypothetical protein
MPKAQVLVTVSAEALVELPADVADVEAYCREHVALEWGGLQVERVLQPAAVTVSHFLLPEAEPVQAVEPEPVEPSIDDTLALPVAQGAAVEPNAVLELMDDPEYRRVITAAVRERAERLLVEVVDQVVAELEPLLHRHHTRNLHGAQ